VAEQYYAQGRRLSAAYLRALFVRFQGEAKTIYPRVQEQIQGQASTVVRTAHVAWNCALVHLDGCRKTQHLCDPPADSAARNVSSSTPSLIRNRRPPPSTNSMLASNTPG
jgi:hypothetical protein